MYKLLISSLAHEDLDNIANYLAVQLKNPTAALAFLDEAEKCYAFLRENPLMYGLCEDNRLQREGFHKVPINNYVLLYKVDTTNKNVHIYRCFHGTQNYLQLI